MTSREYIRQVVRLVRVVKSRYEPPVLHTPLWLASSITLNNWLQTITETALGILRRDGHNHQGSHAAWRSRYRSELLTCGSLSRSWSDAVCLPLFPSPDGEAIFKKGEAVKVVSSSDKRGYLVVEHKAGTCHVPFQCMELKVILHCPRAWSRLLIAFSSRSRSAGTAEMYV